MQMDSMKMDNMSKIESHMHMNMKLKKENKMYMKMHKMYMKHVKMVLSKRQMKKLDMMIMNEKKMMN